MIQDFNPDNKVLERLMTSLQYNRVVKKTHLQLASKLRWDLFSKYWEWMITEHYIKCENPTDGKNNFMLTSEGTEMSKLFLRYYENINSQKKAHMT